MVPIRSQVTWQTLLDSVNGWKKPCEKPLRAWRRSRVLWSASHCCMLGISSKEVNVAFFLLQVYIIAHVPVGYLPFVRNTTAVREPHNERLVAICRQYSSVIMGHFYGHTHRDSIMVLLDQQGEDNVITSIINRSFLSGCFGSRFWDYFWLLLVQSLTNWSKTRVEHLKTLSNWILCGLFLFCRQTSEFSFCGAGCDTNQICSGSLLEQSSFPHVPVQQQRLHSVGKELVWAIRFPFIKTKRSDLWKPIPANLSKKLCFSLNNFMCQNN